MRVLLVSGIFPPDIGGPARYIPLLAAALTARGHDVTVISLTDSTAARPSYPFRVDLIPRRINKLWRVLRTVATVVKHARQRRVILANTLGFEAGLGALLTRRPIVHKVVGDYAWERARNAGRFSGTIDEYQGARKPWPLWVLDWWRTFPLRRASRIVVPSSYLRTIVGRWSRDLPEISVIYNTFHAEGDAPPPLAVREKVVITVCRLVSWKGVPEIMQAMVPLQDYALWIVGDGPLREQLEQTARDLGIAERTVLHGAVEPTRVGALLRRAAAFVLNSSYEGLPHVVLEAMAAGVPVVATRAGGTSEVVVDGESGFLVNPGDTPALTESLRRVVEDPATSDRLVRAAHARIERHFSETAMIDATEELLRRLSADE